MNASEPHENHNGSRRRWPLGALPSLVGIMLVIAIPGAAQDMNKSRKVNEMSEQQQAPKPNPDLKSLVRLVGTYLERGLILQAYAGQ